MTTPPTFRGTRPAIASLSLREYFMGRDKEYPPTSEIQFSAAQLVARVNHLFQLLQFPAPVFVSSGYRPGHFNKPPFANGAPRSGHLVGRAVDLRDPNGRLGLAIMASGGERILAEAGLWLERLSDTPGWVHLDTINRPHRIFIP